MNVQVHPRTHCRGQSVGRACAMATPSQSSYDVTANRQAVRSRKDDERSWCSAHVETSRSVFSIALLLLLWRSRTSARYLNAHPTWAIRVPVFPSLSVCGAQRKDQRAVLRLVSKKRGPGRTAVWPWLCGLTRTFTRAVKRQASFDLGRQPHVKHLRADAPQVAAVERQVSTFAPSS
jgi:hypothetical protein